VDDFFSLKVTHKIYLYISDIRATRAEPREQDGDRMRKSGRRNIMVPKNTSIVVAFPCTTFSDKINL
jgi:hypothetical protein